MALEFNEPTEIPLLISFSYYSSRNHDEIIANAPLIHRVRTSQ